MKNFNFVLLWLTFISCQPELPLKTQLQEVIKDKKMKVGLAVLDMKSGKLTEINGHESFPLQSVFKFHIATKVLDEVDKGNLQPDQLVSIGAAEIMENTWSPLREEHGKKDLKMRIDSLIYYMVSLSDNNACDILLRQVGGPSAVNEYVRSLGISDTRIEADESEMHRNWEAQFRNVATPVAMVEILKKFYLREFLSGNMHNFLWAQMEHSPTGKKRLRAGLAEGSVLAHKTGTSGRSPDGISAATNDAGIIILPGGQTYIVAVFITDSQEDDKVNEKVIADIAKILTAP